jgi:hypothetical protein
MRAVLLVAIVALAGCATPPRAVSQSRFLMVASCPQLVALVDDSFGSWVLWAQYAAATYAKCRAAALGETTDAAADHP